MTPVVTIVVPVAPYHEDKIAGLQAEVDKQTLPCALEVVIDTKERGAAWARNEGVRRAQTPYVLFLDADDHLHPRAAENLLRVHEPNTYAYGDYVLALDDSLELVVCGPGTNPMFNSLKHHVVNCLMHKAVFEAVGGFDETIVGFEDTEFWLRCAALGVCGLYTPHAIMTYTRDGRVSGTARQDPAWGQRLNKFYERYNPLSCCGGNTPSGRIIPAGTYQDGFILVRATWMGNRSTVGLATGNTYPRTGNYKLLWVDPADQQMAPQHYDPVDWVEVEDQLPDEVISLLAQAATTEITAPNFSKMNMTEIKAWAQENALPYPSGLKRDELIAYLEEQLNE